MTTRYEAVFISPHLDDAVFSCGGEIARLARRGPVLVLNLFTGFPRQFRKGGVVLGPERYGEERAAARFLGFDSQNVGELDATFRRRAYASLANIFRPPRREDVDDFLPALRERVFARLAAIDYRALYVPLAIGWHVDHVLAHLLFEPCMGRDDVVCYEDLPYCLLPHITRYRLDELGACRHAPEDLSLRTAPGELNAWWSTCRAYAGTALVRNLRPRILRWCAPAVAGLYLRRLIAFHRRLAARTPRRWILHPLARSIEDVFERKLKAMALYRSQFRQFFSGPGDCARRCRAYAGRMRAGGDAIERYWRFEAA